MYKLLIIFLFICSNSTAQLLKTVNEINTYSNPSPILIVTDSIRGGIFFIYNGTDTADNGMIFLDANNNKWKRSASVDLNVMWYGASASSTGIENWNAITAAKNYLIAHRESFDWLYFPPVEYIITYTLLFTESIKLKGAGSYNAPTSLLTFPYNTTGIAIHEYNYDFTSEMKDLHIRNAYSVAAIDSNKHLIDIRCKILMDNIHVSFASGVGINLEACAGGDSTINPIFGNVDFSIIKNCKVEFALHGYRTNGCDANYITFHNCDAMQSKRWGIYDNGFLGNNFYSNSFAANSNASLAGTATTVTYGGDYYSATFLHDDGSGINKQPDLFPTYWTQVTAQAADPWDSTTHYWSGGAFASTHPSGTSQWYSPYVEGDQPAPSLNTRSIIFAGVRGAGTGLGQIFRSEGVLYLNSATNITGGKLGIGVADVGNLIHPLQLESTTSGTIVDFKTSGLAAILNLKSAGNSDAFFWSQGYNLYYGINGVQMVLNAGVFKDYVGNGVVDLGSAGNRFKDVHAVKYYGDASSVTGLTQSQVSSLVTDLSNKQPLDADLTTIAGLTATTDNFMQAKAGAWASRTIAQVKTDLDLAGTNTGDNAVNTLYSGLEASKQNVNTNLTSIGALANASGYLKNNGSGVFTYESPPGAGTVTDVSVVSTNGFAGTVATSTSTPAITITTTITGLLKGNGTAISAALAGTDYLTPTGSAAALTSFPTFNQNTTGSAASLLNTRTIWGQNFNGTANVTGSITLGANDLTMSGSLAATGARVTKGWFTDIESTNMLTVGGVSLNSIFQPLDADLTTIAGLTATTDNFMQAKAGAWASRTIAQVKTDLDLTGTNSGNQTLNNTSDATSHTVTLSTSGGTIQLIEGANITLTTGGTGSAGTVTIAGTGGGSGLTFAQVTALMVIRY